MTLGNPQNFERIILERNKNSRGYIDGVGLKDHPVNISLKSVKFSTKRQLGEREG